MIEIFNLLLVQPLFNAMVFLYNIIPYNDLGLAIIALTIIIKLLLLPLSQQSIKSQKALQELQPKIEEVKQRYKGDKEAQARAMMELYKQEKVNPLSSCLPLLIQLPFLFAVFYVFQSGLNDDSLNQLYPFVVNPGTLNPMSFGFLNLAEPNIVLAVITGAAQFVQAKMLISKRPTTKVPGSKDEDMMAIMNKQMTYFMPIITVVISVSLPSGLVLYWLVTTLLTIAQQHLMFGKKKPSSDVIVE